MKEAGSLWSPLPFLLFITTAPITLPLTQTPLVMAPAGEAKQADSLVYAPTWAVASVCFIFIVFSLIVERLIFGLGRFWRKRKQLALYEALEKIKEELMVVGFVSLALAAGANLITKICVSKSWKDTMPQCKMPKEVQDSESTSSCSAKGEADYLHSEGIHQLHIFMFVLAVVHVVYSVFTMGLGMWKVHRWKHWESMSSEMENASSHVGYRYTKDATFVRRHVSSKNIILSYIAAFFRQFYQSMSMADYNTLRHGFLMNHGLRSFDFHTYIMRSLQTDFEHVVGISVGLWGYMVLLMLLNVEGWGMLYWSSLLPLVIVLAVGAKLQHIITQMAIHSLEKHAVIEGMLPVKPRDDLFWFGRPRLILSLIHFILFQDAIEVAFLIWIRFYFAKSHCFNQNRYLLAGRIILGLVCQFLCGYIVLPIYALVSQMGTEMKKHDGMELGDLREEDQNAADSINQLHGADVVGGGGDKERGGGQDSIMEVGNNQDRFQRRMSYMEKVTRGVKGEDYHKINTF